jgi:hypothetical protein
LRDHADQPARDRHPVPLRRPSRLEVEESEIALSPGLGCRIYTYVRETESARWTFWSVTDDETALLMSYACSLQERDREAEEVEEIVRSARLYHSAPVH